MCQIREENIDCYYPPASANQAGKYVGAMPFEFVYVDEVPDEMKAACEYAGKIWGEVLASDVACRVRVFYKPRGSGILASASSTIDIFYEGFLRPCALVNAMKGQLSHTVGHEIQVSVNSDISWYFGLDGQDSTKFDFVTLMLHEIGHGLGFYAYVFDGYNGINGIQPEGHVFSSNFVDENGTLIYEYGYSQKAYNALKSKVYHQAGGRIYNPSKYRGASSFHHFNEGTYKGGTPDALMTPFFSRGEAIHEISELTKNTLYAMGWTAPEFVADEPTPEPEPTHRPADYRVYDKEDGVMLFEAEEDGVYEFSESVQIDGQEVDRIALKAGLHKITIPNLYFNIGTKKYDNIMSRRRAMSSVRVGDGVLEFIATEDAYVRGGSNSDTNYNNNPELVLKYDSNAPFNRDVFLKFDLGSNTINNCNLHFFAKLGASSLMTTIRVNIYEVNSDWNQTQVTFNTKPPIVSTIASNIIFYNSNNREYQEFTLPLNLGGATGVFSMEIRSIEQIGSNSGLAIPRSNSSQPAKLVKID